jgi:nicotinate dehydrogenase subunit A
MVDWRREAAILAVAEWYLLGSATMASYDLTIDGEKTRVEADADTPLLYVLRDQLGLRNPRFGCGLAQCGACTVLVDENPTRSCVLPISAVGGPVTTIAGLGTPEKPHPLQTAYIEEEVTMCGYCDNGWLMAGAALLAKNTAPSQAQIVEAFTGLKCRCGTHMAILRAMRRATKAMA